MVRTLDVRIARLSPTALCTQHTHRHLMFGPGTHQLVQAIVQICSCGNRGLQRLQCRRLSARLLQAGLGLNTSCRVRVFGESQGSVLSPQPQTNRIGDCSVGRPMNTNPGWIQALAVLHPEDLGGSIYLSPVSPLAPSLSGCRAEPSLFRCVPAIRREWAGAWWFGKGQGETGGLKGKTKLDSVNKHWAPFPEATSLVPSLSAPRAQDSAQGETE